ncbi:DUF4435 domain-containing protein [Sphingobacterium sp.]|uniref:DUF4435 domain-containing protein n=1 Tax=Sphingobacterium sp. TaxID=341027 RepID=UPI002589CE1F|nr:DUF4435 domain-containing protein [Sphingobacterium sp.]WET68786.1 MAG: DUF4435 domain-containing protein [Sphingobacterium sp.]
MLKYNNESRKLSSRFKAYRNDINIFTEDEEKDKEFYTLLLKRLLGSQVKINDITPLGCKNNVLKYCNDTAIGKKEVYIVDGDIKVIHNNYEIAHPNLFILDRYCIENYLLDENSAIKYIYNNSGTHSESNIKIGLQYQEWLSTYAPSLVYLFIHFAIADYFNIRYSIFSLSKYLSIKRKIISFNEDLLLSDVEIVKNDVIEKVGKQKYEKTLNQLQLKWKPSAETLLTIVSGKNYLIPLLQLKTQDFKRNKDTQSLEVCKISLVQHFDINNLERLRDFILNIAS